jgi:pSer/pThr/pTyr-binding forkhead associated (FHA) protein
VGWQTVSPYHAELRYQNGKFVLVDKQSDNGSFVNRVRTGSNVLEDGMSISFGKVEFIYRQPAR